MVSAAVLRLFCSVLQTAVRLSLRVVPIAKLNLLEGLSSPLVCLNGLINDVVSQNLDAQCLTVIEFRINCCFRGFPNPALRVKPAT